MVLSGTLFLQASNLKAQFIYLFFYYIFETITIKKKRKRNEDMKCNMNKTNSQNEIRKKEN